MSLVSRLVRFSGRVWLSSLKAALWMSLVGILVSFVQVSLSQSGMGSGSDDMNETNVSCVNTPETSCSDLPSACLNCSFDFSCVYGDTTIVNCTTLDGVQCVVSTGPN